VIEFEDEIVTSRIVTANRRALFLDAKGANVAFSKIFTTTSFLTVALVKKQINKQE
jgi:hypothetical protein